MGLENNNNGEGMNLVYVKHGGLVLESDEPREGYEKKDDIKNPTTGEMITKYIQKYSALTGRITNIRWYDTKDEYTFRFQGLKIIVDDGDVAYTLDLPYGKRSYDNFTKMAENIDYKQPITFIAFPDKEDPQTTVFTAKQDGNVVRQKYTKNDPGDCPPATENKRTGKWNFDAQRDWLLDRIHEVVIPCVQELNPDMVVAEGSPETDEVKSAFHDDEPVPAAPTRKKVKAAGAKADGWDDDK